MQAGRLRDGESWWASIYGVTQSWTRLTLLSSSSSSSRLKDGRGGRDNAKVSVRAAGRMKLVLLSLLHLISSFSKLFSPPFCWSDEDTASVNRWADSPSQSQAIPGVCLGTGLGTPKLQSVQAQACAAGRQPGGGQARSLFI